MPVPLNVIANADDLGYSASVNAAISTCYEMQYINSASLLTNMAAFDEAVDLIRSHPAMLNIGVHIDIAQGRPLTNIDTGFLGDDGCWNIKRTGKTLSRLSSVHKNQFYNEICAQIEKAMNAGLNIVHLDSHYHLHTLPSFFPLFFRAARQYKLKLRLAQTYREKSYLKYWFRKIINLQISSYGLDHSKKFETVQHYIQHNDGTILTEVMLHPDMDSNGNLNDHYDPETMKNWIQIVGKTN